MKRIISMAVLLLFAVNSQAGIDKGNGGDTTAQSFVQVMNQVYLFLEANPRVVVKASRIEAKKSVRALQASLGAVSKASLIEVQAQRPRDEFGISKDVVTTVNPLKVLLHKESWNQSGSVDHDRTRKDQVTLAAMELLLLSGVTTDRYKIAEEQIGQRYEEVLAMSEVADPGLPPWPQRAIPLEKSVTGRQYITFDDAFVQALKNSKFRNCTFEIKIERDSWRVDFYRLDGSYVYGMTKGYESVNGKQISWDGGKKLRMRSNARPWNNSIVAETWDPPIQGVISQTIEFNEDETEVKSIDFASYLLQNQNKGTPLRPHMELVWQEVALGRSCER